ATILDAGDHTGQGVYRLLHGDDQFIGIVPDFGIGSEAALHCFDIALLDCIEKLFCQCSNIIILRHILSLYSYAKQIADTGFCYSEKSLSRCLVIANCAIPAAIATGISVISAQRRLSSA